MRDLASLRPRVVVRDRDDAGAAPGLGAVHLGPRQVQVGAQVAGQAGLGGGPAGVDWTHECELLLPFLLHQCYHLLHYFGLLVINL